MENFKVKRIDSGEYTTLHIGGFLDAHTAPHLEEAIQNLIDEQRFHIVVNFKDLNYISSAGLGVFMGFVEQVRKNNGDIKMCSMTPKIFRVFDLLGFPTLFEIVDEEQVAVKKFNEPNPFLSR